MVRIAYLILAHDNLTLVYRQIDLLVSPDTKFFIHFDKKSGAIAQDAYSHREDVEFLKFRYNIHWGGFNMVKATVALLKRAINEKFDYYILLSGQCFPIKRKSAIDNFLYENRGRSFIQLIPLPSENFPGGGLSKISNLFLFDQLGRIPDNYKKLLFRYLNKVLKIFGYKRKLSGGLIPFFGSQWWALSHEMTVYLLNYIESHPEVFGFFRYTWAPDELAIQTILGNSPFRRNVVNKTLHYIDWSKTDHNGSPKTLTIQDFEFLNKSEELFARKFDSGFSAELLNALESSCS